MTARNPDFHQKRSFARYPVSDGSAAILEPGNILSYCILDVSKSGIAFCYNGTVDERKMVHMANVTIFGKNIESSDFSVRIIYDIELNEENFSRHHLLGDEAKKPYLRRCGVKFQSLSRAQQDSLNMYIQGLDIKPELSN